MVKREQTGKTFSVVLLISALLLTTLGTLFVNLAEANPSLYPYGGDRPPPSGASPLLISVSSPKNNTIYGVNTIAFAFNVSTPESFGVRYIGSIYYNADWLPNNMTVKLPNNMTVNDPDAYTDVWSITFIEHNIIYHIPDGEHNITIIAKGGGRLS